MAESFELTEKPGNNTERNIGLVIAVIAVILAFVSSAAHDAQNEEIVLNVKAADQYNFYEARKGRLLSYQLAIDTLHRTDPNHADEAAKEILDYTSKIDHEQTEADKTLQEARDQEAEARLMARRANVLDYGEIALQISIVLCSISILTEMFLFVYLGLGAAGIGVVITIVAKFFFG
jgi:hypothetical protein